MKASFSAVRLALAFWTIGALVNAGGSPPQASAANRSRARQMRAALRSPGGAEMRQADAPAVEPRRLEPAPAPAALPGEPGALALPRRAEPAPVFAPVFAPSPSFLSRPGRAPPAAAV